MATETIDFVCDECGGKVIYSIPKVSGLALFMASIQGAVRLNHQKERGCGYHNRIRATDLPKNVKALVEVDVNGDSSSGKISY